VTGTRHRTVPGRFATAGGGYRPEMDEDGSPRWLRNVVDKIFRGQRERLSRAEIQRRIGDLEPIGDLDTPALIKLAGQLPEGNYERHQAYAVLDLIDREQGRWPAAA